MIFSGGGDVLIKELGLGWGEEVFQKRLKKSDYGTDAELGASIPQGREVSMCLW